MASATTITQTVSLPGGNTSTAWSVTDTTSIAKFDTGLGTLQDIRFVLLFNTLATVTVTDNNVGGTADVYNVTGITQLSLSTPNNALFTNNNVSVFTKSTSTLAQGGSQTVSGSLSNLSTGTSRLTSTYDASGNQTACHASSSVPGFCDVDPLDISDFVGTGFASISASAANAAIVAGPQGSASWSGTADVSLQVFYDYTAAQSSTPEPASMVLFGSALVGLGLFRKRIKG